MFILPESIKTLINAFKAVFAEKKDVQTVSDDDILNWLNEEKVVEPVTSASGEIYTTNNNNIYIL